MQFSRTKRIRILALAVLTLLIVAAIVVGVIFWQPKLPAPGSPAYVEYAEEFEVGTAALDVDRHEVAAPHLSRAIEIIPREPAAWANRGLLYLRTNQLNEAANDLNKAYELAPNSPELEILLGLLAERRGA